MAVRLPSGTSPYFPCARGLRQGCPLSPTLFTLFFDHLADFLNAPTLPGGWPRLVLDGGVPVLGLPHPLRALLFADDVVLVARTHAGLRSLLARLEVFCLLWQLEVNVGKTKAMAIGKALSASERARPPEVRYDGRPLQWVTEYKYLGLPFSNTKGFGLCEAAAGLRVRHQLGALSGLLERHKELGASIDMRQRLFDTLVLPGGDYGCVVWSLPLLPPLLDVQTGLPKAKLSLPEAEQRVFLRRLLSAPDSTSLDMLYREARRRPWASRWAAAVCRFWNHVVDAPRTPTHLTPLVLDANVNLWLQRQQPRCWAAQLAAFLASVQPPDDGGAEAIAEALSTKADITAAAVTSALHGQYDRVWANLGDPRDVDTLHRRRATYHAWFWMEDELHQGRRTYLHQPAVTRSDCRRVASFRMGHHDLGVNDHATAFGERTCSRCAQVQVDDALHLLFECDGVGLPAARARHGALLSTLPPFNPSSPAAAVRALSNTKLQVSMAMLITDLLNTACPANP